MWQLLCLYQVLRTKRCSAGAHPEDASLMASGSGKILVHPVPRGSVGFIFYIQSASLEDHEQEQQ